MKENVNGGTHLERIYLKEQIRDLNKDYIDAIEQIQELQTTISALQDRIEGLVTLLKIKEEAQQ
jgi:hypothetical protein